MPSAITTMFGSAIPCRRAARFGVSPTMPRSCASPRSDQVADDDQPGRNADTGLQRSARLEPGHRRDQLQPRPHRPLRVVLMGLRIAKIHQHAVAHVLGHEPAEATHGLGDAFLIGRNDLAQVLRVHAGGERRRTDQVREHHRDLATLSRILALRLVNRRLRRCWNGSGKLRNRCQHLSPMPERDAELFEVLIGQMTEDGSVDVVFTKTQGVLGHAELLEPIRNLLHCEHPATVLAMTKISDKH